MTPETKPWDRLECEADDAWHAFCMYLQRPAPRRYYVPGPFSMRDSRGWYRDHRWDERARAWDDHLAAIHRGAVEAEIRANGEALGRNLSEALHGLLHLTLAETQKTLRESLSSTVPNPSVKLRELTAALKEVFHVKQLVDGKPTEILDSPDLDGLDVTELLALKMISEKVYAKKDGGGGKDGK